MHIIPSEKWRPVYDYEELYDVSNLGKIWGIKSSTLLKPGLSTSGYLYVQLSKKGKQLPKQVHRLVIEAFDICGPIPKGIEVNHKNGIKTDNRLENLEPMTRSENLLHRVKVLGIKPIVFRGEDHGNATFSDEDVRAIRQWYEEYGLSVTEISRKCRCSSSAIRHIIKRRSWKHI